MNDLGELGQVEAALYRAILNHPNALLTDIADLLDHDAAELDKPMRRLAEMGLVRTDTDERLNAISPM